MLLYTLGKCSCGEPQSIPFSEIEPNLLKLLREFGPSRKSYHPEYPFWWLQSDGLWELTGAENLEPRKGHTDPKKSELVKHKVAGGFPKPIYDLLSQDSQLVAELVQGILERNFPASIHEDLLDAIGFELDYQVITRPKRDPRFRNQVMVAYEYRCAVCGFDVRLGGRQLGIEAAHIKWHQAGGPDTVTNGLALCVLHHKLFDRGAFTVSPKLQVQVSEQTYGTSGFEQWLMAFHGKPIREPQSPDYHPSAKFLKWHLKEVFRKPMRHIKTDTC